MSLSEFAALVVVSVGIGVPVFRHFVAHRNERRQMPVERFDDACREAGFTPVVESDPLVEGEFLVEGENTWRGESLGFEVLVRRRLVEGDWEVDVLARLPTPLHLGLELTTWGSLPEAPPGSLARPVKVSALPSVVARAIDVDRAAQVVWRISERIDAISRARYGVGIDDDQVRIRTADPFGRQDLSPMLTALTRLRGEVHAARSRGGIAEVDDDIAVAWAAFAEKRGLTMSAGPTLSGVLAQTSFEASVQFDRATGNRTTDVVLLEEIAGGHMFSFVACDRDRTSIADPPGETGDAALDRRYRLLVSNASGRALLEDERLRSLLVGLPPSVGTIHLASLGLRLGTASPLDGEGIEEIVRRGDEVVRLLVGRTREARAPYR